MSGQAKRLIAAALALICTGALAPTALGATKLGASYAGESKGNGVVGINLFLSKDRGRIKTINMFALPGTCTGAPPIAGVKADSPKISKKDRFTATLKQVDFNGQVTAKGTMSGHFVSRKLEKGQVVVRWVSHPECNGSFAYETRIVNFPSSRPKSR